MDYETPQPETNPQLPTQPQFQLILRSTQGDNLIASSDTVNDLVAQAKYWINVSSAGAQLTDGQIRSVILQEIDPATGNYVDSQELPAESKADAISVMRALGAR